MMTSKSLFIIVCLISCQACQNAPGDKGYMEWVRDYNNGLHVKNEVDDLIFDLQYQPSEYVWIQRSGSFDEKEFSQNRDELDQIQYFTLSISSNKNMDVINSLSQNAIDKQRVLYYFSYTFQNDIQLEQDGELLPCVLYHFERNVDIRNGRSFVLGFENKGSKSNEVKLAIKSDQLNPLPIKIKISKRNTSIFGL